MFSEEFPAGGTVNPTNCLAWVLHMSSVVLHMPTKFLPCTSPSEKNQKKVCIILK